MKSLVDKAFSYLDYLVKPSFEELGGILGDNVRVLRYKNQLRLVKKVEKIHSDRNITTRQIPLKTIASLLNHASYEEEEQLVDMWASLLANATDSGNDVNYHHVLVKILSEMSASEALVLTRIAQRYNRSLSRASFERRIVEQCLNPDYQDLSEAGTFKLRADAQIIIDNLVRLGVLSLKQPHPTKKTAITRIFRHTYYELTMLGRTFMHECEITLHSD